MWIQFVKDVVNVDPSYRGSSGSQIVGTFYCIHRNDHAFHEKDTLRALATPHYSRLSERIYSAVGFPLRGLKAGSTTHGSSDMLLHSRVRSSRSYTGPDHSTNVVASLTYYRVREEKR